MNQNLSELIVGVDCRCLETAARGGVARILWNILDRWSETLDSRVSVNLYFHNVIPSDLPRGQKRFKCKKIKGLKVLKRWRIVAEQLLIPLQARLDGIDVLFSPWYSASLLLPKKISSVVAIWDISYSTHPSHYRYLDHLVLHHFSSRSAKRAKQIVTCSDFDKEQICREYSVSSDRVTTLYLAADEKFRRENISDDEVLRVSEKLGLPDKFILSLGVIHNRRNVDKIINSFSRLGLAYRDWSLVVVGRDQTNPPLNINDLVSKSLGVRGRYIDWIDDEDLPGLYAASQYFVCTSTVDGESILIKEAILAGASIITSPLLMGSTGNLGVCINDPENEDNIEAVFESVLIESEEQRLARNKMLFDWCSRLTWADVGDCALNCIVSS